jgi:hypothetical protein
MANLATALLCAGWSNVESTGERQVSASIEVRCEIVAAEGFEITTTLLDEELGAWRVEVATTITGGGNYSDARSYLLMTDLEPHEAMAVSVVGGESFFHVDEAVASVDDITHHTEEEVADVLAFLKDNDFAFAVAP